MLKPLRGLGFLVLGLGVFAASAAAQTAPPFPPASIPGAAPAQPPDQAASNPVCARLEGQLAVVNRSDPVRADQIKRFEDSIAKQQAELDRLTERYLGKNGLGTTRRGILKSRAAKAEDFLRCSPGGRRPASRSTRRSSRCAIISTAA